MTTLKIRRSAEGVPHSSASFGRVAFSVFVLLALPGNAPLSAAVSSSLVPLNQLGSGKYLGFTGGLYADGRNEPWGVHAEALRKMSAAIQPLARDGRPDANGKIVIVGLGASVCVQIFKILEELAPGTPGVSAAVAFVNGAKGGHDVNKISDPERHYWESVEAAVAKAGFSAAQVQAAWYQSDDLVDRRDDFPGRPQRLKDAIARNMRESRQHFPNLRICYHSGRHTTAFAPETGVKDKHGEPRPYHVGWAVKWLIEEQSSGRADLRFEGSGAVAPLVAWATYFWTDAGQPRQDGYRWTRDDVVKDGVHLSKTAQPRVAKELIHFWLTDPFSRNWFAAAGIPSAPAGTASKSAAPARRPNVLVIQPDQHRGTILGCMGDRQARTPNLDRLAKEGVLFRRAASSSPVCSPFRGSMQTGLYPHQHGVLANDRYRLDAKHPTFQGEEEEAIRRTFQMYYAQVAAIDVEIGRLLDGLKRIGADENTIILYTSDHGDYLGSHARGTGTPRDVRGKGAPYATAFRIPLIVRWPAKIPAGQVSDALVSSADLAPTLLDLAGAPPLPGAQGSSMASWCLTGQGPRREAIWIGLAKWRAV